MRSMFFTKRSYITVPLLILSASYYQSSAGIDSDKIRGSLSIKMIPSFILFLNTERTGKRMRSFLLIILITLFPSFSFSDEVTAEAQRFLNELCYNAGPVDGLIGGSKCFACFIP